MAMDKLFKGILQYSAEQFKSVTKESGYIYLVRTDTTKTDGDAEIWFGTRRYGNVEATKLADLTERLGAAEGKIINIEAALGEWTKEFAGNLQTVATVVKEHDNKLSGIEDTVVDAINSAVSGKADSSTVSELAGRVSTAESEIDDLQTSLVSGETAMAIKAAKDAADAAQGDVNALEKAVGAGFSETKTVASEIARVEGIADAAQTAEEVSDAIDAKISGLTADSHTHSNKALLDTYTQTEANLADAVAKKHEHSNKTELDKIAEGDKAKWDDATDAINAFLATEGDTTAAIDTLKEIQDFLTSDDGTVETLLGKVDAIEDSLAEGGATANAIAAAQKKADDAYALADAAQTAEEVSDAIDAKISGLTADSHTHSNKALLDTYTQTEANLADAVAKKHEHSNKTELDKIAEGDKAKWDDAVQSVSVADGCEMLSASKAGTTVTLALYYGGDDAE